jgi:hypothetical protein
MFSELFTIHGNHSGHGIHLIGHYRWLLRFIAVFFIRWFPNYHLGKFANGFLGSLVILPRLIGEVFGLEGSWLSAASCV